MQVIIEEREYLILKAAHEALNFNKNNETFTFSRETFHMGFSYHTARIFNATETEKLLMAECEVLRKNNIEFVKQVRELELKVNKPKRKLWF